MKWLDEMQRQVLSEFRSIWKGHSEATDQWFERTCAPAIIEEISEVLKQRRSQARQVEMHWLDQKALAEVWTGLADALPSTNLHGATGPKPNESSGKDPGPVAEGRTGVDTIPRFPKRAAWFKAKLAERDWNKHELQRHGGRSTGPHKRSWMVWTCKRTLFERP
jgi:hypothetical protein